MKNVPRFPSYASSPSPTALNPMNPRHYLLLLTWIYFQPGRLKGYLYRSDVLKFQIGHCKERFFATKQSPQRHGDCFASGTFPEAHNDASNLKLPLDVPHYRATGRAALWRTLRFPAYRNLYMMAVVLLVLLSVGLVGVTSLIQSTTPNWTGVMIGIIGGLLGALIAGPASSAGVNVAFGAILSVIGGVTIGIAGSLTQGAAGSVAGSAAVGLALGMTFTVTAGTAGGILIGVGTSVIAALINGIALAFTTDVGLGVVAGVIVLVCGSRLAFALLEWPLAWWRAQRAADPAAQLARHPVIHDELAAWPLPGSSRLLRRALTVDLAGSLEWVKSSVANPYQRWTVQRALSDVLTQHPDPLDALYTLTDSPALDDYVQPPVSKHEFRTWPTARQVILGELGQTFVDGSGGESETWERIAWRLTRRLRDRTATPLSRYSAMLYQLIRDQDKLAAQAPEQIQLASRFAPAYEGVRALPHGDEVANTLTTLDAFLNLHDTATLANAHARLGWIADVTPPGLRPNVVETLQALGDVSHEVSAFQRATHTGQQAAALNRAAGALNELDGYVESHVSPPERALLARLIEHWQSLVADAQGKLGEAALREMTPAARRAAGVTERASAVWQRPSRPLDNPYVVGDPVYPPLLVGRKDVFDRIGEVWSAKTNPDSIILYGHRRMGKSSILRNLDQVAPAGSLIVYADMAGETSFVASTADLLLGLADRLYAALRRHTPHMDVPEPEPAAYATPARAQIQFNRLLESVRDTLSGAPLILALDEFEAVEHAVEEGKIGVGIYQFLRAKTQEPWLTLVFGGLHTLDEMSRDYQQPFYGSYENIRVSYLTHDDAWHLITNPGEGFDLNYERAAVERIIAATGGQPYLVQQVCRDALDHLNHELFDLEREREVLIQLTDIEAVLGDAFFQRGTVYFDGVWTQASAPAQRALLHTMAQQATPWTFKALATGLDLDPEALRQQLRWAVRHDILRQGASGPLTWAFCVPLMRAWIQRQGQK